MIGNEVIVLRNISKQYGDVYAIEDVSFVLNKGDMVALIGPNGSGKSTLVKMIVGLETPTSGTIFVNGKPAKEAVGQIGYVPQYFSFDRSLPVTVREFLSFSACHSRDHKKPEQISQALTAVGLVDQEEKILGTLSGGQLQRVLIARALAHEQDILVLDEPSASIDVQAETALYELLQNINKEKKVTVIVVSHELDFVFQHAEKVICVNRRLMCKGIPHDVLSSEFLQELYGVHTRHYHHEQ